MSARQLAKVIPEMDIVFCSALVPSRIAPVLLTEEMVAAMRPGSVIVDISIDQGGNCAITTRERRRLSTTLRLRASRISPACCDQLHLDVCKQYL